MKSIGETVGIGFLPALLIVGCEGDAGKPGLNLLSDDLQAPVVELILPLPERPIFEQAALEAIAVDDKIVVSVEFLVDGQRDGSGALTVLQPPYQVIWDCWQLTPGFHAVQAAAWDGVGRIGLSNTVIVRKDSLTNPPASDTLRYYEASEEEYHDWLLPGRDIGPTAFGVRLDRKSVV